MNDNGISTQRARLAWLASSAWLCLCCASAASAGSAAGGWTFYSCTDYHCDAGRMVTLTPGQWQPVRALFVAVGNAAEERASIARAIALLETAVGGITGTWRDLGGNVRGAGQAGQLDCISESLNTTTYLRLLHADGLLKWHQVEERRVRQPLLFNVHWTAVIVERDSGERFAVDSWHLDNGSPPRIQPLQDWLAGRSADRG